jgi:hypothetical protein
MRPLVALVAAIAVSTSASPALAASSPMFDQFERLCLKTRAEPAAVAKAVASADWTIVDDFPPAMLPAYGGPFDQVTVRSRPAPDDDSILLVSGVKGPAESQGQVCTLSGPFDPAAAGAAKVWLEGVKPISGPGPDGLYMILETPEGRRAATRAELKDRANLGKLMGLTVATAPDEVTTLTAFVGVER